jgi:hypothetical protein
VSDDDDRAPATLSEKRAGRPAPHAFARALRSIQAWRRPSPHVVLAVAGCCAVVAVNVVLAQAGRSHPDTASASASATPSTGVASAAAPPSPPGDLTAAPPGDAGAETEAPPPAASDERPSGERDDGPPSPDKPDKPDKKAKGRTVQWAADRVCSTAHVDGLSRQIIEEARCLDANAFSRVPARRNLTSEGHVFLYLDAPAKDHLLRALDAHKDRVMKVHSALRTVAQQYLLSRWAAGKRCGIQLATRPGESNHETGLALDVADHGAWRSALESEGFRWLGSIDRVHFDFVGAGATHHDGLDVRAFQRLWNRNHPDDAIAESGHNDGATEQRLKRSPASGFPIGARCGGGDDRRMAHGGGGRGHGR